MKSYIKNDKHKKQDGGEILISVEMEKNPLKLQFMAVAFHILHVHITLSNFKIIMVLLCRLLSLGVVNENFPSTQLRCF